MGNYSTYGFKNNLMTIRKGENFVCIVLYVSKKEQLQQICKVALESTIQVIEYRDLWESRVGKLIKMAEFIEVPTLGTATLEIWSCKNRINCW